MDNKLKFERKYTDKELEQMGLEISAEETDGHFFAEIDEMIHEGLNDPEGR